MKVYGKENYFDEMGDSTTKTYIPLDFNTAAPLLQSKPVKVFSICENSFSQLTKLFKQRLTKKDKNRDLLIFMRVRQNRRMNAKAISKVGWKISAIMSKNSLVTWSAQGYDIYRFDFYFYDRPKVRLKRMS